VVHVPHDVCLVSIAFDFCFSLLFGSFHGFFFFYFGINLNKINGISRVKKKIKKPGRIPGLNIINIKL
jgi:hypothetical protein